jgi:MFS family permease
LQRNPTITLLVQEIMGVPYGGAARGTLEWFPARERALVMGIATTCGSAIGAVLAPPLIRGGHSADQVARRLRINGKIGDRLQIA